VRAKVEESFRRCLQKIREKFRYVMFIFLLHFGSLNITETA